MSQRLKSRKTVRVPRSEQIRSLLASDREKTRQLTAVITGHPKAINTKLTRLVNAREIVKARRGVNRLLEL